MQGFLEHLPAILMIVVGFGLVVVEMYIPGFGAPGILGTLLLIIGVCFTAESFMEGLILTIIIIALLCICLTVCMRSAYKGRLAKSKLVLKEVAASKEDLEENAMNYFVGKIGIARTVLRPSGMAEFDGVKLNVVSDGEFIAAGKAVRVERVDANRILVRECAQHAEKA